MMSRKYYHQKGYLPKKVVVSTVKQALKIARSNFRKGTEKIRILDVGCGRGEYTFELEKYFENVTAVEPNRNSFAKAMKKREKLDSKVKIYNCPIEDFKTSDKYDVVLALTIIEHMPNAEVSFRKIFSMLDRGGIIFLTAPNKLWPFDHHYRLPFLTWLPPPLANFYVRLAKRGVSFKDSAYSKTYFGLKRFFDKLPCSYEFVLPDPQSGFLACGQRGNFSSFIQRLGIWLIARNPFFWVFSKGFIMVIKKQDE